METVKEKNLPLAIGLNLLLPGTGYIYMGKWIVGTIALLLIIGIYASTGALFLLPTWLVMNAIMAIDMVLLAKKNKEKFMQENTKRCPNCAELIQKEAKMCRYCHARLDK